MAYKNVVNTRLQGFFTPDVGNNVQTLEAPMRRNAQIELSSRMFIVTNAIAHNMMAADNNRQQGKTKKKRGPNWTSKEDEILSNALGCISTSVKQSSGRL